MIPGLSSVSISRSTQQWIAPQSPDRGFLPRGSDFVVRRIFEILDIFGIQRRRVGCKHWRCLTATLQQFHLTQTAFQPFPTSA